MPPVTRPPTSLWRLAGWGLLLLAATVLAGRAHSLLLEGFVPSAHGEARWYRWAVGPPGAREALLRQESVLREQRSWAVVASSPHLRSDLVEVTARYLAPGASVRRLHDAREARSGETVLDLDAQIATASEADPSAVSGPGLLRLAGLALRMLALAALGAVLLPRAVPRVFGAGIAWAHAWAVGWCLAVVGGGLLTQLGLVDHIGGGLALLLWGLAMAAAVTVRARDGGPEGGRPGSGPDTLQLAAAALAVTGLGLVAWKVLLAPLWSWDHVAIWGFKARYLAEGGALAGFADVPTSAPHYPLGVPAATALLGAGGALDATLFKVLHLTLVAAAALLTVAASGALGAPRWAQPWLALGVALLPLFWSTEILGLAELPLALALALALVHLAPATSGSVRDRRWRHVLLFALALGALAFSKDEGLALAVLLLAVACGLVYRRQGPRGAALFLAPGVALLALARVSLPLTEHGTGFADGDWRSRLSERLQAPGDILSASATELLRAESGWVWLAATLGGVWLLVRAARAWSVARRERAPSPPLAPLPLLVLGVMGVQCTAYVAIYFVTYLDPEPHIISSLARIATPLELGLLAALAAAIPVDGASDG